MLAPMELGTRSLVGRGRELSAITAALAAAESGRGSVWLVTGEPGIGKSRFVEEVARASAEREISVLWGRAWEAGGAPAYWLFIQVLRALLRLDELDDPEALLDPHARAALAELLPELRDSSGHAGRASAPLGLDPDQAHFRVMDAATRVLLAAVRRTPLVIILEDLHASDPASAEMLGLLAQQARDARIVIVGTYRESDAQRSPAAGSLARIARTAERISLDRLSEDEARDLLARVSGASVSDELSHAVYAASEGNPLFVNELARLHALQRLVPRALHGEQAPALAIPASIKSAIRSRLSALSPRARQLLGLAAVIGREHRSEALELLSSRPAAELVQILDECLSAEVLLEVAPGLLRFSHILLREVAYADLDASAREAAHAAFADQLADQLASHNDSRALSERAHHLLLAGPASARAAYEASRRAGQHAFAQHASIEAASWHARALASLRRIEHSQLERCVMLIELAEAQLTAHAVTEGDASCLEAAEIARALGDSELLSRAALTMGVVFRVAEVNPQLVALLSEALAMLPAHDHALRAKVMARLAAALQPAPDVEPPIALAHEAIAMARRLGEPQTLLEVIRAGCSAMLDLAPPLGCVELCREHRALAERLGNDAEAFRANMRLAMCAYAAGLVPEALAAVSACQRIAEDLEQPHFRWRATAMAAMRALWLGQFQEAEALHEVARGLAEQAGDRSARASLHMQRVTLLELRGDVQAAITELQLLERVLPTSYLMTVSSLIWSSGLLLRAGRKREALELVQRMRGRPVELIADATVFGALVEASIALEDRALIEQLYERGRAKLSENVTGGVFGMTWDMPVRQSFAELCAALGRWDEAKAHADAAFAQLRALGARPHLIWALADHARACRERGELERGARLLSEARAVAAEIGVNTDLFAAGEVARLASPSGPAPVTVAVDVRFVREGEYWSIERDGRAFRLKDGKGIAMLARLIHEPGRELHVLDLSTGAGGAEAAVDGGDAGALLDSQARAAYEGRVRELREELEEAERHADMARTTRAREELDAIASELSRAVGLGGRDRRAASAVERARVNVQRRLRDALERIREHDPELGRHLTYTVKTGTYCSYLR
jgi:hypothetical protein